MPEQFQLYSAGLADAVKLLQLLTGDPRFVDTALLYEQLAITDAAIVVIPRVQSQSIIYSIAEIQFSETSGRGRYLMTGGLPTAAGFGMPIVSGGTRLVIRGAENLTKFAMIAEAGETMEANITLFKAQIWMDTR